MRRCRERTSWSASATRPSGPGRAADVRNADVRDAAGASRGSPVARARPVDVFALRSPHDAPQWMVDGVRVHRLDVQRHQGAGLRTYLGEYLAFLLRAAWAATREHRRRRYAAVQVHTLPDFLVFAALPRTLAGVPVLLDLHEAMPEFFRMRFPRASSPLAHRLLLVAERLSIASADAVRSEEHPSELPSQS